LTRDDRNNKPSGQQRKMLAGPVNQFTPTLNLFDKVLAIPGVAALIKSIVDGVRTTLTVLSTT